MCSVAAACGWRAGRALCGTRCAVGWALRPLCRGLGAAPAVQWGWALRGLCSGVGRCVVCVVGLGAAWSVLWGWALRGLCGGLGAAPAVQWGWALRGGAPDDQTER
eukprot:3003698-Prymnesium_polylepis.1